MRGGSTLARDDIADYGAYLTDERHASRNTVSSYLRDVSQFAEYLEDHQDIIQGFTNAIQKGLDYVNSHTAQEIAAVIAPQFTDTDEETIAVIVERYKNQDTWKADTIFTEESFNLLQDILQDAGELENRVPYEDLVTTQYAQKAAEK